MLIGIDGNEANVKTRVGSNQYVFELLWSLYRLKTAHQFFIFLHRKPFSFLPPERKNWIYKVFGPSFLWTRWRLPLKLYLEKPRPDVFFTPGHYAPSFCPMPLACSIMDLGFLKFPNQFTRKDLLQLSLWTKASVKKAAHILAISQATRDDIMKKYKVPGEKITVTYPGYNRKNFQFPVASTQIGKVRKKYKIDKDYILFLGTFKPSKNIEGLIEAFGKLGEKDLKLVIAGKKGWLYQSIFDKVKKLGLEEKIVFTGFVPDGEVPPLMAGAKVFVMPSFWEGFGFPVLEAMAVGCPVVVSNAGSLPEVVGKAGILVNPLETKEIAKGIKKALAQKEMLIKKGLLQAKRFSWQVCAQQTLEVLESIR